MATQGSAVSDAARKMALQRAAKLSPERRKEIATKASHSRRVSPARRKEIAQKAAQARWAKEKKHHGGTRG